MTVRPSLTLPLFLLLLAGCQGWGTTFVEPDAIEAAGDGEKARGQVEIPEQKIEWGSADDPKLFDASLEYKVAALPQTGAAATPPWAGSYWPIYQDSINKRWDGASSKSAAAKYGEAFGVADIEDKISASNGIDKYSSRTECEDSSACNSAIGESCAIRLGETKGRCIPTWWGICHAWAPASFMEPEPIEPVTVNGVEFKVQDIKALLTLSWDSTDSKFVSLRCNEDEQAGEIEYDGYSRPTGDDTECRDTNPGTYHVLLANYLGLRQQSFVEDRTFDDEVWNQPLRGYRITSQTEITGQAANALIGVQATLPSSSTKEQLNGTVAKNAWTHGGPYAVTAGAQVEVDMTGTGDADLYVRVGSQPTTSAYDCRPYASGSDERCELTIAEGATELFVSVRGYATSSTFETSIEITAPNATPSATVEQFAATVSAGQWNHHAPVAVVAGQPVVVAMEGTEDADLYVRFGAQPTAGAYDCRPYVGTSSERCELTAPAGATQLFVSVNGYAGSSAVDVTITLTSPDAVVPEEYVFNDNAAKLFHVKLEVDYISEAPSSQDGNLADRIDDYTHTDRYEYVLEVDADGKIVGGEWIGDSKKNHPDFLWLPTARGTRPIAGGAIDYDKVQELLDASVSGGSTGGGGTPTVVTENESGSVAKDAWVHFGPYEAVAGSFVAAITGTGDADLYVRKGSQPTSSAYDCRPWKNGSTEQCNLEGPGSFYVSIQGYTAATFALTVTYTTAGEGGGTTGGGTTGGGTTGGGTTGTAEHLNATGDVASGEMKHFSVDVFAGQRIVVRTTAPNDVDLYVRMNAAPTTSTYDQRGYTATGNETIDLVPSATGKLHIAVHGYEASSFTLTTADE